MNYWQNYPKFMVSLLKAAWGKAATKENDFGYAWLPKVDGNYSWMYIFDDMYRGSSTRAGGKEPGPEGLITFGMNPVGIGPNSEKMIARALEAEVAGRRRERRDRDGARSGRRPRSTAAPRPSKIQTEVFLLPAARLRREGRHASPTRRAGSSGSGRRSIRRARRRPTRRSSRGSSSPCATSTRRRAARFPSRSLNVSWSYTNPVEPGPRRGPEGDQRQGARRHPRSQGQDEGPEDRRPAARRLRPAPGRRLDDVRQLAPLRRLHRGRQQRAAPHQRRPDRPRHVPQLGASPGRPTGASCTTAPPPTRTGKPWDPTRAGHQVERREVGRRRARHEAGRAARDVRRVHHAARGRRPALRAGLERRPVPRALRGRSRRRSTTRSIRRSRSNPVAQEVLLATRTSTARRRTSRSSARPTG